MFPTDPQTSTSSARSRWLRRGTIALLLIVLTGTSVFEKSVTLLLWLLFIFSLVFAPIAVWRKRLGWLECGAATGITAALFAVLIDRVYLAPMQCETPTHHPYAITFVRSGEPAKNAAASVDNDGQSISLSLSLGADPARRFVALDSIDPRAIQARAGVTAELLESHTSFYVPTDLWIAAAEPANIEADQITVWRMPVFYRADDDFHPAGDVTGVVTLPAHSAVQAKPFHLLRSLPGNAGSTRKRELGRYSYDAWLESVFRTARPPSHLEKYRAIKDRCWPDWIIDQDIPS